MSLLLSNCCIFTSQNTLIDHSVLIEAGSVKQIIPNKSLPEGIKTIDLGGDLLVPGFIDTQVNGANGILFNNSPNVEAIKAIGMTHRKFGTTGFLPTLISDSTNTMQQAIDAAKSAYLDGLPGLLGIHLEGPFLNKERKGVHCETKLSMPTPDSLSLLTQIRDIGSSMVTLAPEVVPVGFIKSLIDNGIIVSVGHSNADSRSVERSIKEGVRGFTHLFNAMSQISSREPGVVGAALQDESCWCGIIADGHHVHPHNLKIALAAKPKGKIMLVTDAMHTVGAQGSMFFINDRKIYRENGKVTTAEGTLAGSDLNMADAVKNTIHLLNVERDEALRMASLYPAQFLKLDHLIGRIAVGYRADFALLDKNLNVTETWINGIPS